MRWYWWILIAFIAIVEIFIWACCYVGGKADDLCERAMKKRWVKPKVTSKVFPYML